ncbi:multiple C2 and transmembrane domain-containing protein 1-like isoform X2 [Littorina saxatilis]|uniref:multiple C2 and transmembrane domain-containing protein 1-like isoform X2 n=1 Tax=Littorina saxatilis TaxID=31220 RepID=UPI0038B44E67
MHAFLKRQYKKGRGKMGSGTTGSSKRSVKHREEDDSAGPIGTLKYQDAVSKSMDSLLMVASSVPLPTHAQLTPDPGRSKKRGRRLRVRGDSSSSSSLQRHSDQEILGMERRHSFDYPNGKFSDDDEEDDDDTFSEGGVSRSLEVSPVHRGTRTDSMDSRDTFRALHQSFLTSLENSASFTSEKGDFTDSDNDNRSYVSFHDDDSRVFVMTADENDQGDVVTHEESPHGSPAAVHQAVELSRQDTILRQRQNALMEHPFFMLEVRLQEGKDLVIRDSCGTSDPYVKFKIGGKQVYRSKTIYKNLNPKWDETFTIPVEDVNKPVNIKVFDYDRGLHDDPMGNTEIDVSQLELGKSTELKLLLSDRGKPDYMGYLLLTCTLQPKTQEDKDQFLRRTTVRPTDAVSKKMKMQPWSGVVTIVLVEGQDLVPMDDNGLSDPYVKFRLGNEKCRSKHKSKTLSPKWLEQFDLRQFQDLASQLEITVFDYDVTGKDDFMGRAVIDLSTLELEITHHLDVELEDGAGMLKLLLTISGQNSSDAQSDLCNYTPDSRTQEQLMKKYSALKLSDITDVGTLQVKVFKATGLKSADIGGQSDPFCVLELVNARVQTHTEYKTLNPEWNKVFTFKVRDIHSVLEVTIFDEDRDKKVEFLGKVAIPLLRIKNGERRWYALKERKLVRREKGAILLEMDLVFNNVKAAIRTVKPAEEKFMQVEPKFKIHLMKRNIDRVGHLISTFVEGGKFVQSCFNWESTPRSATAFIVFLVMVWNFEMYMLPITLLLIFLKNLIIAQIVGAFKREQVEDEYFDEEDEEEDEEKEKFLAIFNPVNNAVVQEEKKSFKEKLQSIQDVCLQVQQGMDMVASLGERVKNTFNWSVPWLSTLAVVALSVGVLVLYFIPIRLLILAWGINKFTKKLRKPNAISNNELFDFLSRVPSDSELQQYREMRPEFSPTPGKKKRS